MRTKLFEATVFAWPGKGVFFAPAAVLFLFTLSPAMNDAYAQAGERGGKDVAEAVCAGCHTTGEDGAPRIGDAEAWAPLAARGLTGLTESALKGVRNMPAHGGELSLSDIEMERAITYMVNQSGGNWVDPINRLTPAVERKGAQVVQAHCAKCHNTGVDGAPRIGNHDDWIPRVQRARGFDLLVSSAIHGHGPMPARGGFADVTDAEIRAAIIYMYHPDRPAAARRPAAAEKTRDRNHQVVGTMGVFLGVISAEAIRAQYPQDSPERLMHGGTPAGTDEYHVNISLIDSATGAPVEDARVVANVEGPRGGTRKPLERMTFGDAKSYGNYFQMPARDTYKITVSIWKAGASQPVIAEFDHKHY
jgi:cytochrome c5